eukprot:Hpha_TRINITY_DN13232_c0_g2::TRINITY_DN13232_c0_g2_i2::g.155130::m.155130
MVFTVLAAADLSGTKVNYEVDFTAVPSMPELHRRITDQFGPEAAARRPPGVPASPFTIQRLQVFDERVELWVELLSASQLQEFCQVYVFQPETAYHKEVQSKLPAAVRPPPRIPALEVSSSPRPIPVSRSPHHSPVRAVSPTGPRTVSPTGPRTVSPTGRGVLVPAPVVVTRPTGVLCTVDNPTHDDKVRAVFDELDVRKARVVELDHWRTVFARVRVDLSPHSVNDLFAKADVNHDGVVSFDEFQRFAERFPTLLDALFCRAREFWVDVRQKEGIDAARRLLDSLRSREADARTSAIQATAETNGHETKLQVAISDVAEAEMREREYAAVLTASQHDSEQARAEVAGRVSNIAGAKERVRAREVMCIEAAREVERADAVLRAQDAQTMAAEDRLREIERMLEDARRELEVQRANGMARRADVVTAQSQEQATLAAKAESERELAVTADRLNMAESALARAQDRERECGAAHLSAREETARKHAGRDVEERELTAAREREAAKRVIEAEAARAVEAQDRMAQALESENIEHNMVRLRVEDEEKPLIEQEVRLREQRDALEMMELKLRSDHGSFQSRTVGRAGLGPSPRRGPTVLSAPAGLDAFSSRGYASSAIPPTTSPRRPDVSPAGLSPHGHPSVLSQLRSPGVSHVAAPEGISASSLDAYRRALEGARATSPRRVQ